MSQDRDYIVRATAAEGSIRAFAITSRHLVEEARVDHDTSPVITAALGRLLSGAAMMGTMMKGEKDLLTIQIQCGGPAKGFTVTADANGHVKGFPNVPDVELPLNAQGKLDVGGALGLGVMSVIKDMGLKEPYRSVRQAGGFIIQLMPFTPDDVVDRLEKKITEIASVTEMLEDGKTPEEILELILGEFGLEINDTVDAAFQCDCSKERVSRAIATLSRKDLDDIVSDGESIEVKCQFCNKAYHFDIDELKEMRK